MSKLSGLLICNRDWTVRLVGDAILVFTNWIRRMGVWNIPQIWQLFQKFDISIVNVGVINQ